MHTGEKIKIVRNLRSLTQTDLAEKINKTRALVSHIELTGKVNYYTLIRILKALKISEEEFDNLDPKKVIKPAGKEDNYVINEELDVLRERLQHYQKENETLQQLVDAQKTIIDSLRTKK